MMTINTHYYKRMTVEFLFAHSLTGKDLVFM